MRSKKFILPAVIAALLVSSACLVGSKATPTPTQLPPPPTPRQPTETLAIVGEAYDGFDGAFALPWIWKDENPAKWSLVDNPGFLGIHAGPYSDGGQNILLLPLQPMDFTAVTYLVFEPVSNFQVAGLSLYVEDGIRATIGRAYCDTPGDCVGNGIYFDLFVEGELIASSTPVILAASDSAYLALDRTSDSLMGLYSENGEDWTSIGTHPLSPLFDNAQLALFAGQDLDKSDPDTLALFDYVQVIYFP